MSNVNLLLSGALQGKLSRYKRFSPANLSISCVDIWVSHYSLPAQEGWHATAHRLGGRPPTDVEGMSDVQGGLHHRNPSHVASNVNPCGYCGKALPKHLLRDHLDWNRQGAWWLVHGCMVEGDSSGQDGRPRHP
jgi:hypothetical protein